MLWSRLAQALFPEPLAKLYQKGEPFFELEKIELSVCIQYKFHDDIRMSISGQYDPFSLLRPSKKNFRLVVS